MSEQSRTKTEQTMATDTRGNIGGNLLAIALMGVITAGWLYLLSDKNLDYLAQQMTNDPLLDVLAILALFGVFALAMKYAPGRVR